MTESSFRNKQEAEVEKKVKIYQVTEKQFLPYGKVLAADAYDMIGVLEKLSVPEEVVYIASYELLEACESRNFIEKTVFGGLPVQIGYCSGHNRWLNALEYHKSSEVNVAATDLILLLGKVQEIREDCSYDSEHVEAFLVPKGTVLEIYGTTLHYAPCQTNEKGFAMVVALPRGTNTEIDDRQKNLSRGQNSEGALLFQKNKWLLAHPDAGIVNAFVGIKGSNIQV